MSEGYAWVWFQLDLIQIWYLPGPEPPELWGRDAFAPGEARPALQGAARGLLSAARVRLRPAGMVIRIGQIYYGVYHFNELL